MIYTLKIHAIPPVEVLRHYFRIDKHWRLERRTQAHGWRLCSKQRKGSEYFTVCFEAKVFMAHRIIWALHHGKAPEGVIDHINGCRWDNRIENLRDVDHAQNRWNAPNNRANSTGHQWVAPTARGFKARIVVNYEHIYSPEFADAELAGLAAQEMRRRHLGEYVRAAA